MKKITSLLFFLLFISSFAQISNFSIDNGQIHWQKIYESKLNKTDLLHFLKSSNKFSDLSESENSIYGITKNLKVDFKKFSNYPSIFVQHTTIISKFIIDFKENKYRVTVKDIIIHDPTNEDNRLNLRDVNLERYCLKNNNTEFNSRFISTNAKFYDVTFFNLFNFGKEKNSQDW
ncbi:hypothetical protein [Chryseobacterium terrae]|uniref:DUF3828 domain-containing protein n=1 Tax=Chryseobacterium terrae TaxID=3163299 RepID=A0ABW8Y455_9FLAO